MGTLPDLSGFSRPWLAGVLLFGYWWAGGMPAIGAPRGASEAKTPPSAAEPANSFVIFPGDGDPYRPDDGREAATAEGRKVVRGGSWRDRPSRATSSFRLGYAPFQKVYNVGFRVVGE